MFKSKNLIFILSLMGSSLCGQNGYQIKVLPGFLISHHPEMQNMEAHVLGIELNKFWTLKHSQKPFNGLKVGFSAMYMHLGKPNINGSVINFLPSVETNLTPKAKFPFMMRWSAGIGYITKPFSYPDNRRNKAIGTHFNGCMQMQFSKNFRISETNKLILGMGLTHFSNGNFKKPNLGINMAHLNLGYSYVFENDLKKNKTINPNQEFENRLNVTLAWAKREVSIDDPQKIHIGILGLDYKIAKRQGHFYRLGMDFFFDRSYPYEKFTDFESMDYSLSDIMEHGLRAGYEWQVNKVSLIADVGVYTYRPQKLKRRHYFTIGLNYHVIPKIQAFVKLKTHLAVADYFQWGLSYSIYEK